MGRPQKNTADYFPHFVSENPMKPILFILEQKWGNNGYSFWYKLLELLCTQDGHFYDNSNEANKIYLSAYVRLENDTVEQILSTLSELGAIDAELWEKKSVIWCQHLLDALKPLYAKRTISVPEKPDCNRFSAISREKTIVSEPKTEKPRKPKPEKKKYAEFVTMTQEEYEKLTEEFGKEKAEKMIQILDNYKGSKGKTYKSDYRAILSWVVDRVKEEETRNGGVGYAGQSSDYSEFIPSDGFRK